MSLIPFMQCWWNSARGWVTVAVVVASLLYPGLVYFGRNDVPPAVFVGGVFALIGLRLVAARASAARRWRVPLLFAALGLVAVALLDISLAVRAYPVLVSLGVAAVFGFTLYRPPSFVEGIARLQDPDLPPKAIAYCRLVTTIWVVFLVINAGISAGTAVWGSLELWSLWTGFLSYLFMGMLFLGEMAVRPLIRGKRS